MTDIIINFIDNIFFLKYWISTSILIIKFFGNILISFEFLLEKIYYFMFKKNTRFHINVCEWFVLK